MSLVNTIEYIPEGLLDKRADELHEVLPGPTLIHLPGKKTRPLFVSVLLHGNETTGWEAVKQYLQVHQGQELPRALSLFIGNISAAREHKRVLDGQPDYNRVWACHFSSEGRMMSDILREMRKRKVFASLDIHNNTGKNPHYACINRKEHDFLQLAHLFSSTVVYFIKPDTVQSMAFAKLCPAVTVECGQPEQKHGVEHAVNFIDRVMQLDDFDNSVLKAEDFNLYHTMAIIRVPENISISFDPEQRADIVFDADVDNMNFTELPAGTRLASIDMNSEKKAYLQAIDEQGNDVAERYFEYIDGEIRTRIPLMPSMLTTREEIIRQDCLCYMMERINL